MVQAALEDWRTTELTRIRHNQMIAREKLEMEVEGLTAESEAREAEELAATVVPHMAYIR